MKLKATIAAVLLACGTTGVYADGAYSLTSPGLTLTAYVAGATLPVTVTAPIGKHAERITLRLNGKDVTSSLHPDASGALTGTVSGLTSGANTLQLFAKKDEVATLTVMKGMAPAATCDSLAALTSFPIQPAGTMGGTIISAARIVPATGTVPEYCLVQGTMEERFDGIAGVVGTPSYRTNQRYRTLFEVRLPSAWNGRYMFQGSGGTEGGLPGASGQIGGTSGLNVLGNGFVVASQNGGHANADLPPAAVLPAGPPHTPTPPNPIPGLSRNQFFPPC